MDISDFNEKDFPNYKIIWVDGHQMKHTVLKFKASNDDEARLMLDKWRNEHSDKDYYWSKVHYVRIVHKDKTMTVREMEDNNVVFGDEHKPNIFVRLFEAIGDFFAFWFWQKPVDWWYKLKDIAYLVKHGEARSNQWNLDMHLIDTIILNVPSLIKHSHGMMFLDEAIKELHKDDANFDIAQYHNEHCQGYPEEVEKLAMEIQQREYNYVLLNAKLYKYYVDAGIVDTDDPEAVEFDKQWRKILPVAPGSYDQMDYTKLHEMYETAWSNVWEWVKQHGHTLYD